ncbi:MAG: DUF2125 domain-containing protein [Sedimentitalea sp.]
MMWLVKAGLVACLLWSAYWYGAGFVMRQSIVNWFETQAKAGWQADYGDIFSSGYPTQHFTTLEAPALADPQTGMAWQADHLHIKNPAIWPGRQVWAFPVTPQRMSYLDQNLIVVADQMEAAFHLRPDLALSVAELALTAGAWQITQGVQSVMSADDLTVSMRQSAVPETYQIDISAAQFQPGNQVRRLTRAVIDVPETFQTLALDMSVRFDRAWDISALEDRRPQPLEIDLKLADLHWGALRVLLAGKLVVDDQGWPTGQVTIKAENWRDMLAVAEAAGALTPTMNRTATTFLDLMARSSGNPDALDVPLNINEGVITMGFIPVPLGRTSRFVLR